MSEDEVLQEVRRLYLQWKTGLLPSEDLIFQLGDILNGAIGASERSDQTPRSTDTNR
jgi:hypothetical protein